MATLKRYTKTTPTGTLQTTFTLSGAGTSTCNGIFTATDQTSASQPIYTNGTTYLVYASNGVWYIKSGPGLTSSYTEYYNFTESSGVLSNWNITNGASPAPSGTKNTGYSGDAETLFTVASGKADAIISIVLNGGSNGGTVTLYENNGTADFSTQAVTLTANENIVLDYKQFLEAGDSFKVGSTATGINVTVNVYEKDQA